MSYELRARAATAALELFGFNKGQRRGPDGKWIKMGGAGSAGGRARGGGSAAAQKPTGGPRQLVDVLDALKSGPQFVEPDEIPPEVREWAEDMFSYTDPETGYSSTVTRVQGNGGPNRQDLDIAIKITDADGREVGLARRRLRRGKNGQPQVDHVSFYLDKSKQGGGFSSRWLRQAEDRYREAGIKQSWLIASEVGSYAWAKAGYDFADRDQAKLAASRMAAILRSKDAQRDLPQRVITDGNELIRRARTGGGGDFPTPMEFAMLGWTPGAKTWVGKETMLNIKGGKPRGLGWEGIKEL